ncbi:DUF6944 family repetitive protein [Anoxybacillus pushchinoensis]|uniref:DUF6944 family repetitive protein n=1 Tax=Anoxybacillus pushchinoensis TaxID=150248 RepID=UPI003CC56459
MQAIGNALEADDKTSNVLCTYGNGIQSIGNVTVVATLLSKEGERLEITGNYIHAP